MHTALLLTCLAMLCLAGCSHLPARPATPETASPPIELAQVFPTEIVGWQPEAEARAFDRETIFQLVDGQAEAFFAYNFERAAVRRYQNRAGTRLMAEIWQVATPADAFGLFTSNRTGAAVTAGNGGSLDPAGRLCFWQERYFVSLHADGPLEAQDLQSFGSSLAERLPQGGEPPALVQRLPSEPPAADYIFFRQEISIQSRLWLGSENLLQLEARSAGLLASYELDGQAVQLLLVEYPQPTAAQAALQALLGQQPAELQAANSRAALLGAVFGTATEAAARQLLAEALQP
jgi:hypothetical protein